MLIQLLTQIKKPIKTVYPRQNVTLPLQNMHCFGWFLNYAFSLPVPCPKYFGRSSEIWVERISVSLNSLKMKLRKSLWSNHEKCWEPGFLEARSWESSLCCQWSWEGKHSLKRKKETEKKRKKKRSSSRTGRKLYKLKR